MRPGWLLRLMLSFIARPALWILLVVVAFVFEARISKAQVVTISTVPVGSPGNDSTLGPWGPTGAVSYNYRIGTTEVTNLQYVDFLNAAASSDPYDLYNTDMGNTTQGGIIRNGSDGNYTYAVKPDSIGNGPGGADGDDYTYGNKPVIYVTWYDSIRFTNWLHNGQPTDGNGTETGAYTLLGGTPTPTNGENVTRSSDASWFLPNVDEWFKAAYYDPANSSYFYFPTSSDSAPNNNLPSDDTGNSVNVAYAFRLTTGDRNYPLTDVGAYTLTKSPYGTLDQAGNVWEWVDGFIDSSRITQRSAFGGSWTSHPIKSLGKQSRLYFPTVPERPNVGFRVASIPEPSSFLLMVTGVLVLLRQRSSSRHA